MPHELVDDAGGDAGVLQPCRVGVAEVVGAVQVDRLQEGSRSTGTAEQPPVGSSWSSTSTAASWSSLDVRACMATVQREISAGLWLRLGSLLGDDLDTQVDALVADVDAGAGDQLVDLALVLAAKTSTSGCR
jgi:hypothetical protein